MTAIPISDRPKILEVNDLRVTFQSARGTVKAVDGITFSLAKGEKFGLVGESGSGKTTAVLALMQLIRPPGVIESGEVLLDGVDILKLTAPQLREIRGAEISLVPQGAMNSLNPVMRIKEMVIDTITAHDSTKTRRQLKDQVSELLSMVGLETRVANSYPHELSGGMKQRVGIALAIAMKPKVIIADEPTSALDVIVQAQVINTLESLRKELGIAIILVGHDMGLMAQFADRIGVMYAGNLVEVAPVPDFFDEPLHPYSDLLIASVPKLDSNTELAAIPGAPPSMTDLPEGCRFHPRCPRAMDSCSVVAPQLKNYDRNRMVSCLLFDGANR